jgi:hypothetical protein
MNWKRSVLLSVLAGLVISGGGLLLVHCGGYGPCGPASTIASVGAFLSVYHVVAISSLFPTLESWVISANSVPLNIAFLLLVPAFNWAIAIFVLLTVRGIFTTRNRKSIDQNSDATS